MFGRVSGSQQIMDWNPTKSPKYTKEALMIRPKPRDVRRSLRSMLALTVGVVARCLLLGVGAGIVAGCYPAWRASRLAPAEALRGE